MKRPLTLEALQEQTQRIFPGNKFTMYFFDTEVNLYIYVCTSQTKYNCTCTYLSFVAKRFQASLFSS